MNEFTTTSNVLRAHLVVAPKIDLRSYMVGICVDLSGPKYTNPVMVSTDGHRLLVTRIEASFNGDRGPSHIIPRDLVEIALKSTTQRKNRDVLVRIDTQERRVSLAIDGMTFSKNLIDSRFPEYRSVIHAETSGEPSVINERYRMDAMKIGNLLGFNDTYVHMFSNGEKPNRVHVGEGAIHVIMPMRSSNSYKPGEAAKHDDSWFAEKQESAA